jgi:DNA-binding MarR family transcriptional regulator
MSTTEYKSEESEAEEEAGSDAGLEDLPPSAKLVAKVLEYEGTQTQRGLAEETLLPSRTVRYALGRLEEIGLVESRFSFTDARTRLYSLTVESPYPDE